MKIKAGLLTIGAGLYSGVLAVDDEGEAVFTPDNAEGSGDVWPSGPVPPSVYTPVLAKDNPEYQRLTAVINEGKLSRVNGTASPYDGQSIEHALHAAGWLTEDLRQALIKASPKYAASQGVAAYEPVASVGPGECVVSMELYNEAIRQRDENLAECKRLAVARDEAQLVAGDYQRMLIRTREDRDLYRQQRDEARVNFDNERDVARRISFERDEARAAFTKMAKERDEARAELEKARNGWNTYQKKYEELSEIHSRGVTEYTSDLARRMERERDMLADAVEDLNAHLNHWRNLAELYQSKHGRAVSALSMPDLPKAPAPVRPYAMPARQAPQMTDTQARHDPAGTPPPNSWRSDIA